MKALRGYVFGFLLAGSCAGLFALPTDSASAAGVAVEAVGVNAESAGAGFSGAVEAVEPQHPAMPQPRSVAHPGAASDDPELLKLARLGARVATELQPAVERRAELERAETGSVGLWGLLSQALVGLGVILGFAGGIYYRRK